MPSFSHIEHAVRECQLGRREFDSPDASDVTAKYVYPTSKTWDRFLPYPELWELRYRLQEQPVVALSGPTGVGKTHFALCAGYWFRAESAPAPSKWMMAKPGRHAAYLASPRHLADGEYETQLEKLASESVLWIIDDCHSAPEMVQEFLDAVDEADLASNGHRVLLVGWSLPPGAPDSFQAHLVRTTVTAAFRAHKLEPPAAEISDRWGAEQVGVREALAVAKLDPDSLTDLEALRTFQARRLLKNLDDGQRALVYELARLRLLNDELPLADPQRWGRRVYPLSLQSTYGAVLGCLAQLGADEALALVRHEAALEAVEPSQFQDFFLRPLHRRLVNPKQLKDSGRHYLEAIVHGSGRMSMSVLCDQILGSRGAGVAFRPVVSALLEDAAVRQGVGASADLSPRVLVSLAPALSRSVSVEVLLQRAREHGTFRTADLQMWRTITETYDSAPDVFRQFLQQGVDGGGINATLEDPTFSAGPTLINLLRRALPDDPVLSEDAWRGVAASLSRSGKNRALLRLSRAAGSKEVAGQLLDHMEEEIVASFCLAKPHSAAVLSRRFPEVRPRLIASCAKHLRPAHLAAASASQLSGLVNFCCSVPHVYQKLDVPVPHDLLREIAQLLPERDPDGRATVRAASDLTRLPPVAAAGVQSELLASLHRAGDRFRPSYRLSTLGWLDRPVHTAAGNALLPDLHDLLAEEEGGEGRFWLTWHLAVSQGSLLKMEPTTWAPMAGGGDVWHDGVARLAGRVCEGATDIDLPPVVPMALLVVRLALPSPPGHDDLHRLLVPLRAYRADDVRRHLSIPERAFAAQLLAGAGPVAQHGDTWPQVLLAPAVVRLWREFPLLAMEALSRFPHRAEVIALVHQHTPGWMKILRRRSHTGQQRRTFAHQLLMLMGEQDLDPAIHDDVAALRTWASSGSGPRGQTRARGRRRA